MRKKKFMCVLSAVCLIFMTGCGSHKPSAQEMEELSQMLEDHMNHQPESMITCTACGGSGRLNVCDECNGSGSVLLPSLNNYVALTGPCSKCYGEGYENCGQCMNGQMMNPEYKSQMQEWRDQKHEILGQMGYSQEEISQMERREAQAYLDARSGVSNQQNGDYDYNYDSGSASGGNICRQCFGSGVCHNCGGDGLYQNPYTGNQLVCPNCTDGSCKYCNGTGSVR